MSGERRAQAGRTKSELPGPGPGAIEAQIDTASPFRVSWAPMCKMR